MTSNGVRRHGKVITVILAFLLAALMVGSVIFSQNASAATSGNAVEIGDGAYTYATAALSQDAFNFSMSSLSSYSWGSGVTGVDYTLTETAATPAAEGVSTGDSVRVFAINTGATKANTSTTTAQTFGGGSNYVLKMEFTGVATDAAGQSINATLTVNSITAYPYHGSKYPYTESNGTQTEVTTMQFLQLYDTGNGGVNLYVGNQSSGTFKDGSGKIYNLHASREIAVDISVDFHYSDGTSADTSYMYQMVSDLDVYRQNNGGTGATTYWNGTSGYNTMERWQGLSGYSAGMYYFPNVTYNGVTYVGSQKTISLTQTNYGTYSGTSLNINANSFTASVSNAFPTDYLQNNSAAMKAYYNTDYSYLMDSIVRTGVIIPVSSSKVEFVHYCSDCLSAVTFYNTQSPVGIYLTKTAEATSSYSMAGAKYTLYSNTSGSWSGSKSTVATYTVKQSGSKYTFVSDNLNDAWLDASNGDTTYYFLTETSAPTGYSLDTTIWRVKIEQVLSSGKLTTYSTLEKSTNSGSSWTTVTARAAVPTSGTTYSITSTEPLAGGYISLVKKTGDSTISSTSAYSLNGATYGIYTNSNCTTLAKDAYGNDATITTTTIDSVAGRGVSAKMVPGTYYVKEISTGASAGYNVDTTVYTVNVVAGSLSQVSYTSPTVTSTEPPKSVDINLTKQSADTSITDGNSCYSLEGAVYTLYTSTSSTFSTSNATVYGTYTTDANGNFTIEDLPLSNSYYYLVETTASAGYKVDPTVWKIQVTDIGDTSNVSVRVMSAENADDATTTSGFSTVSSATGTYASGSVISLTSNEPPLDDPMGITITKEAADANTTSGLDLAGAQFTIKFYADYYDTVDDLDGVTPTRTWVIETKELVEGGVTVYKAMLDSAYLVSGSDALYYDGATVVIPLGTVTIEETKVPDGYTSTGDLLDSNGVGITAVDGVVLLQVTENTNGEIEMTGDNTYTKVEDERYCSVTLYKTNGLDAMVGVEFQVEKLNEDTGDWETVYFKTATDQTTGETYYVPVADGDTYDADDAVLVTSGTEGKIVVQKLFFGTYRFTETATLDGYTLLAEPIVVTLPVTTDTSVETTADPTYTEDGVDYYCDISYHIQNGSVTNPPMTGGEGIGTYLALGGMALAAGLGCAVVVITRRRKFAE